MFQEMGYTDPSSQKTIRDRTLEYLAVAIPAGRYYGLLAEFDGLVIAGGGVVVSDWPGSDIEILAKRAWILNVFVEPEYRRRGIAKALMNSLIEWCKEQGFLSVRLHASEAGRPLYLQMGFKPTTEMKLKF